jgi:hypothetical protein
MTGRTVGHTSGAVMRDEGTGMEPHDDPEPTPLTGPTPPPDRAAGPVLEYHSGGGDNVEDRGGWVHVYKAADPFEANLIVGKLQTHGIHARVDMENAAALGAWGGVGMGGTTVQALAGDAAAVRAILTDIEQERARRRGTPTVRCPQCGHAPAKRLLHPARKAGVACLLVVPIIVCAGLGGDAAIRTLVPTALTVAGVALLFVTVTPHWRCLACQHTWAQPDPPVVEDDEDDDEDDETSAEGAETSRPAPREGPNDEGRAAVDGAE